MQFSSQSIQNLCSAWISSIQTNTYTTGVEHWGQSWTTVLQKLYESDGQASELLYIPSVSGAEMFCHEIIMLDGSKIHFHFNISFLEKSKPLQAGITDLAAFQLAGTKGPALYSLRDIDESYPFDTKPVSVVDFHFSEGKNLLTVNGNHRVNHAKALNRKNINVSLYTPEQAAKSIVSLFEQALYAFHIEVKKLYRINFKDIPDGFSQLDYYQNLLQ